MSQNSWFPKIELRATIKFSMCVNSTLEVRRLLYKRSEAYIAYAVDKFSSEVTLDSSVWILECDSRGFIRFVVRSRVERFKNRTVFGFNSHFSIIIYSMGPAELKELKTQFRDLVDKSLIQLNAFFWGILVLDVQEKGWSHVSMWWFLIIK